MHQQANIKSAFEKILALTFFILITAASCANRYPDEAGFEKVWQTVKERRYDPNFGGLDPENMYDYYKPKISTTKNDSEFSAIVNKMLFELSLSHLLVASHDD